MRGGGGSRNLRRFSEIFGKSPDIDEKNFRKLSGFLKIFGKSLGIDIMSKIIHSVDRVPVRSNRFGSMPLT